MPCCIDRLRFSLGIFRFVNFFFFFLKEGGCWVAETRTRIKIKKARRQITGRLGSTATPTGGSSVVEQWTVKCSMQRSIGREFKSPSPEVFNFVCARARLWRSVRRTWAGIFGLVGYDARFTRERSRVRFSEDVFWSSLIFIFFSKNKK